MTREIRLLAHGERPPGAARSARRGRDRPRLRDRLPHPAARHRGSHAGRRDPVPRRARRRRRPWRRSCASTRPPTRELVANSTRSTAVFHLPLADGNLARLRLLAEDFVSSEVASHLAVYRGDEVLLWAHDAGDGSLLLARSLPDETLEHFRTALGGTLQAASATRSQARPPARRVAASAAPSRAAARRPRPRAPAARPRPPARAAAGGWSRGAGRGAARRRARDTEPPCSNQHRRTSPKPASASSRVSTSADGKRARSTAGRSGRYVLRWCPVKWSGANVQMKRRPSGASTRRASDRRCGPAIAQRVHDEAHRHRVEPALAEGQVVGLRELERGSAHASLARLREHGLRGVDAPRLHAQALDGRRDQRAGAAADIEQPRRRAEALRDRELELRSELRLRRAQLVVALRHAIEDRRRRAAIRVRASSRGRRPRPRRAARPARRRRAPIRRARGRGRRAAARRSRPPRPRGAQ